MTGFTVIAAASLAFNTFFVFLPNHLAATDRVPLSAALSIAVVGLLLGAGAALVLNRLTGEVGRRPVVLTATTVLAVVAVPLMIGAAHGSVLGLAMADLIVGILVGGMLSMALVAELYLAAAATVAVLVLTRWPETAFRPLI